MNLLNYFLNLDKCYLCSNKIEIDNYDQIFCKNQCISYDIGEDLWFCIGNETYIYIDLVFIYGNGYIHNGDKILMDFNCTIGKIFLDCNSVEETKKVFKNIKLL